MRRYICRVSCCVGRPVVGFKPLPAHLFVIRPRLPLLLLFLVRIGIHPVIPLPRRGPLPLSRDRYPSPPPHLGVSRLPPALALSHPSSETIAPHLPLHRRRPLRKEIIDARCMWT